MEQAVFGRMRPSHVVVVVSGSERGWSGEQLGEWMESVCERYGDYIGEVLDLQKATSSGMGEVSVSNSKRDGLGDGVDGREGIGEGGGGGLERQETGGQQAVDKARLRDAVVFHLKIPGTEGGGGERAGVEEMNDSELPWGGGGSSWATKGQRAEAIVVGEVEIKDVLVDRHAWGAPA